MMLDLGDKAQWIAAGSFAYGGVPSFAGISGGRTSAFMAALLDERVTLCFENTGREHPKTLEFLQRLSDALRRKIIWLEWRPPKRAGAPPREFQFEEVSYETATRTGALFEGMLQALADYRKEAKGLGSVAPWARSRICTAYLKFKTQAAYIRACGVGDNEAREQYVGLRADEPARVSRLHSRQTQALSYRTPLFEAGITKQMVNEFWARQPFDLELDHDRQGNCTGCFLKDHADLSRVLGEPETDAAWWEGIARRFPGFGGHSFPGYEQLLAEREPRLAIAEQLRAGTEIVDTGVLPPKRFKQVVTSERKYAAGDRAAFSCMCETADLDETAGIAAA